MCVCVCVCVYIYIYIYKVKGSRTGGSPTDTVYCFIQDIR